MSSAPSAGPAEAIQLARMVFAWWNTSLAPAGKDRSDENHLAIAGQIVKSLINDCHVDYQALGEVTAENLKYLRENSDHGAQAMAAQVFFCKII